MSTTIDQRVVEMRFDNKNFENNVRTTMSTLERLKQRLNLTGASKGLENLGSAAKKVDLSGVGNGVETLRAKFSALDVIGVTALANIANQAVNTGKKMVSALTIDPIKSGFQEYETQINAVQTILANTSHNGTTLDQVNEALDTLNKYADKTIYNFTEMTRNIGTFTAAGVDLQTSVDSIQGIANLAAVSGSTSQQASTAMYQLSQALAAGKVSLMDWNSVVNAGMGGKVFQDALVRTSELLKTGAKDAINTYGSFRESLTQGEWLTTEVLTETLKQFSGAYSEADLIAQGFTEQQAKDITAMAKTAEEAATKVKTFTQLWDVLKESAQSGWTQTWEILIGGYEDAKNLLSPLADFLTGIINNISDARNKLLEGAMGSPLGIFAKRITKLKNNLGEMTGAVDTVTKTVKGLGDVVDKIIGGEFGNGQARWDKLTKAGYNWAEVQNKVNEKMGSSVRHASDLKKSQDDLGESQSKLNKSQAETLEQLIELSDAKLKDMGLSQAEIKALRMLEEQSEKTGIPVKDLIDDLSLLEGRSLLINTFKNAGSGLVTIFKAIGTAWRDAFPPMTSEQLYDIIAAIHKFSTHLVIGEETADKLTRTLKGVFAIIGMVTDVLGGGFRIAFKAVSALLGYFDMDILDITASIGDALVAFREATDLTKLFGKAIEFVAPYLQTFAGNIRDWANGFMELPQVQEAIQGIKDAFAELKDLDFKEIGKNIIDGLINGMDSGALEAVKRIVKLGVDLILEFCHTLGICSPSKEFFALGEYIIEGLIDGLQNGASAVFDWFKNLGSGIIDALGNINWGKVFAAGASVAMLMTIKKFADAFGALVSPLEGVGDLLSGVGEVLEESKRKIKKVVNNFAKVLNSFSKVLNGFAFSIKAKALKNIAIALGIVVASIIALSFIEPAKLWNAVGVITVLAGVLVGLAFAVEKLSKASVDIGKDGINVQNLSAGLIGIAAAMLILGATVKLMGSMDMNQAIQGFVGLGLLLGVLSGIFLAYGKLVKGKAAMNIDKAGVMLRKMATTLLIMVAVIKLIGTMSADELDKGFKALLGFTGIIALLTLITNLSGKGVGKLGGTLMKMSFAMILMIAVIKLVSGLSAKEVIKGGAGILAFVGIIAILAKITNKEGQIVKLGGTLIAISASMILLVGVIKLISKLSVGDVVKGSLAILAFTGIIALLVKIVKTVEGDAPKLAGTLLAMSAAIAILAGVAILLSLVDLGGLVKGVAAVAVLGSVMTLMIKATEGASECKGNIMAMAVAIGIMAVAVAALSFIDGSKLAGATLALSTLMGMFALMTKAAGTIQKGMGTLIVLTVAVGLLAGVLYLLKDLPVESMLGTAAALSILMLSLSASMVIISKAGIVAPTALISMGIMVVIAGLLGGLLYLLKDLPVANTLAMAESLSLLLLSLSGACLILSAVGLTGPAAFIGVGALVTLIAAVGGLIIGIGALAEHFPKMEEFIDRGMPILEKIGYGLGSFFGNIIGGFSAGVTSGLPEIGTNLSTFMTNLEPFITGAKSIDETALTGVTSLVKMMGLISGASILEKIASWVTGGSSMETFSTGINSFGDAIVSFSNKVKGQINEESVLAAANAGKILAEMQSNIVGSGGVIQWFCGEKDFATFSTGLTAFGDAIVEFSNTVKGNVNEEAVLAAANAGSVMAEMQSKIVPTGGVIQWFCGEKDFITFGTQLRSFGYAIAAFSRIVSGEGAIDETAITAAANAGTMMAEMQSKIVPAGGVVQWFTGEKDMITFGAQLRSFGYAITGFSKIVSAEGAINEEAITAASNAGTLMTTLQSKIVPTGGVVQWFTGEQNFTTFGTQLVAFGQALVDFSSKVAGNVNEEAVTSAYNAGRIMASLQKSLPEDTWFDGKLSLDDFGKKIKKFGEHIAEYAEKVSGIDSGAVSNSISAAQRLVSLTKSLVDLDTTGIENFKVKSIGSAIKGYYDAIAEVDMGTISSSISSANRLALFIKSLIGIDTSGVSSFKAAIKSLSEVNLDDLAKSFKNTTKLTSIGTDIVSAITKGINSKKTTLKTAGGTLADNLAQGITSKKSLAVTAITKVVSEALNAATKKKDAFRSVGVLLMTKLAEGLKSKTSTVSSAVTSPLSSAVSSARGYYNSFYSAGSYLVSGFVNGISENSYKASAKAAAMASAAYEAAKEELDINSPSKVFRRLGYSVPEGFAQGIDRLGRVVKSSSVSMADTAINTVSKSISHMASIINSDIDTQPTIRPVLDLSDVKSGVNRLGGIFNNQAFVGVSANVGNVGYMMSRHNQNGANDDVISAIDKLRDKLGNIGNTTYVVEGVTYDDGSNISNAVKDIVRAAKVERRI